MRLRRTRSIQRRLVTLFVLLALGTTAVFLLGMQRLLQGGRQAYAQPLVADYVDRLAAEIGNPPSLARAQALVQRLPLTVRIEGPQVQYDSHPGRRIHHRDPDRDYGAADWGLVRLTADGHRLSFGLSAAPDASRPRVFGWLTLGALLCSPPRPTLPCGASCSRCRPSAPVCRPTDRVISASRLPCNAKTNSVRWPSV